MTPRKRVLLLVLIQLYLLSQCVNSFWNAIPAFAAPIKGLLPVSEVGFF